jgi:hypothetical protein
MVKSLPRLFIEPLIKKMDSGVRTQSLSDTQHAKHHVEGYD